MNKKLNSVKLYVKFYLQHASGQPIKDEDIELLCSRKASLSFVSNVGNGYVLVGDYRLIKRDELEKEREHDGAGANKRG